MEQPAIVDAGAELTGTYLVLVRSRLTYFQTFFATAGALAGITAGVTGNAALWLAGGLVLGFAVMFQLAVVLPQARRLSHAELRADPHAASGIFSKLVKLHAIQSLAGLAALSMFLLQV